MGFADTLSSLATPASGLGMVENYQRDLANNGTWAGAVLGYNDELTERVDEPTGPVDSASLDTLGDILDEQDPTDTDSAAGETSTGSAIRALVDVLQAIVANADVIGVGLVGLVLVYTLGQLFTFSFIIGDDDGGA